MHLQELLQMRRDTRHFTTDPVPDEVLQNALAAAHLAPSVGLSEAVRFYLVKETAVKKNIHAIFESENKKAGRQLTGETANQYNRIKLQAILDAPVGMIITTDYSVLNTFTIGISGTADALQWSSVCSVQNLWLSLTEQGYSLGWVSILDYHSLKKLLGLPAHEFPLGYFCIGKPATDYQLQPMLQQIGWKKKSDLPFVKEIKNTFPIVTNNDSDIPAASPVKENSGELKKRLQSHINNKTKPIGALGELEKIALQAGLIQRSLSPQINQPHILVFAADHGIAKTGLINPYPQAVTKQMVRNFFAGGAAINVFCKQNNIELTIVDAGVNHVWKEKETPLSGFLNRKIGFGTQNYLEQAAMSEAEARQAIQSGKEIVRQLAGQGCNCIGFGEMGIGNSSSAALIMSAVTGIPIEDCIGRGTGTTEEQLKMKKEIVTKAALFHQLEKMDNQPLELLAKVGGYEIAMMTGAYLQAAAENMLVIVDGFIATAALLPALQWQSNIIDNCIFAHTSGEQGHEKMIRFLGATPLLQLGMRLGEGTGAALAIPLVQSAVNFLNQMASFESASVNSLL